MKKQWKVCLRIDFFCCSAFHHVEYHQVLMTDNQKIINVYNNRKMFKTLGFTNKIAVPTLKSIEYNAFFFSIVSKVTLREHPWLSISWSVHSVTTQLLFFPANFQCYALLSQPSTQVSTCLILMSLGKFLAPGTSMVTPLCISCRIM